jgi:DNA helicase-2/ATP-dependent DNA helicase PcrA
MEYLDNLNDKQREAAVYVDGPLLILAGAGSGKTSTMTRRIAYMIRETGIKPWQILAVTFTNKAAREMRERVESLVGEGINMWIMTFHSACLRILRMNADRIGFTRDFTIYDPVDQKAVVRSCIKALNIDDKKFKIPAVLSNISKAKEKGINATQFAMDASGYNEQIIAKIYREYEKTLQKNNAMDFDDLIWRTVMLFEDNPDVLEEYRERFRYVMVDEYQDTNYMQYRFVRLLAEKHHNICVVGDDDQCIYQWRGADIRNILSFEKDFPGTKVIKLEQNYRSKGNILKAAHSVITHNKDRKDKKLWTQKDDGAKLMYKRLHNEKEEAAYIAGEVERMKSPDRDYSDFAVLYRTNAQSRSFEEAFMADNIPYRVLGGTKFYDRKEIKDMMAYLRLVVNPADDLAFMRVINEPKRGIGAKTIEKLQIIASQREASLFELLCDNDIVDGLSTKASEAVHNFIDLLASVHSQQDEMRISDIYDRLLVDSGYLGALEAVVNANSEGKIEAEGRIENLLEFKSVMFDAEEENSQITLAEFLEQLALVADVDNHDPDENAVVFMTLHSAKGLEFPVVFMPGMEDGLFPGHRSLDSVEGLEEERRLCYVGITRAEERLFMTSAVTRMIYGRTEYTRESVFLKELDKELFDEDADEIGVKSYQEKTAPKPSGSVQYSSSSRPFDQLKYIKQNTATIKKAAAAPKADLHEGDRVNHPKFGAGMIISINKGVASIAFDSAGIKKLSLNVAPLTKAE